MNRCSDCEGALDRDGACHVQVPFTNEYGVHAHVDEAIAPLVRACWAMQIATTSSCQGSQEEPAYVGFGPGSAEMFARAVTLSVTPEELEACPDEALDWRIYEFRDFSDPQGWRWMPGYPWQGGFSVYFPPSDIPELTRRLERHR